MAHTEGTKKKEKKKKTQTKQINKTSIKQKKQKQNTKTTLSPPPKKKTYSVFLFAFNCKKIYSPSRRWMWESMRVLAIEEELYTVWKQCCNLHCKRFEKLLCGTVNFVFNTRYLKPLSLASNKVCVYVC